MLTRAQAAEYIGLGPSAPIPVTPKRVRPGKQGLRYDVRKLDIYLDSLNDGEDVETEQDLLDRPGHDKGPCPRR